MPSQFNFSELLSILESRTSFFSFAFRLIFEFENNISKYKENMMIKPIIDKS